MVNRSRRQSSGTSSFGFTLIELVVVLSIIALLLTIAAPRYFKSVEKSKETVLRSNLAMTRDALDKFYGDNARYPDSLDELVQKRYLRTLPFDPIVDDTKAWILMPPRTAEGGVGDLFSAAEGNATDGTAFRNW
jgi:general secretion pathway protein G